MATITPKISILIPTYNGQKYIIQTLNSVLSQDYPNLEIIISDDKSTDNTLAIIKKLKSNKIKIYSHQKNVGYPQNLERGRHYITGDILFLMGQDDLLFPDTISHYIDLFKNHPDVGAITRPYYWFDKNSSVPVRIKKCLNLQKDEIITIHSSDQKIIRVFDSLDQLSGLAYRVNMIDIPFHPDIFPCHVYPFADIFKKHPIIYVKNYNLAVRIASSQTRTLSTIYKKSPIQSWKELLDTVFPVSKYRHINQTLTKDFIARNYIGLVQIKNYGHFSWLVREIYLLLIYRPLNIINPSFWLISFVTIITPPSILIPLVDWYKNKILTQIIKI